MKNAKQALTFARKEAKECESWIEFSNALFGIGGKLAELFPTDKERAQFAKTPEYAAIMELMSELQGPATSGVSGNFMVRGPRSLHAALISEAEAEGVSLNQLCLAKLSIQLRALTH